MPTAGLSENLIDPATERFGWSEDGLFEPFDFGASWSRSTNMDQAFNDVQSSYDRVAAEYAGRIFGELEHKLLDRQLLDRFAAKVQGLGPVCDLGCGPGHIARYLHERGVRVTGVDLSAVMVELARRLNPSIEFRQGNMLSLDIEDEVSGGIVAFYSIIHVPRAEIAVALAEMKRVLRPGGLLLLAFHVGDETVHLDEWWGQRVSVDFLFFRPKEISDSLLAAGFEIEEIVEREPYPDVEHQSRRAYIFAKKPVSGQQELRCHRQSEPGVAGGAPRRLSQLGDANQRVTSNQASSELKSCPTPMIAATIPRSSTSSSFSPSSRALASVCVVTTSNLPVETSSVAFFGTIARREKWSCSPISPIAFDRTSTNPVLGSMRASDYLPTHQFACTGSCGTVFSNSSSRCEARGVSAARRRSTVLSRIFRFGDDGATRLRR